MKRILTYSLVVVLLSLLPSLTMDAVQAFDTPISTTQDSYVTVQPHSTASFDQSQMHHLNMSCEQGGFSTSQVPADKCILRLILYYREYKAQNFFYLPDDYRLFIHGLTNPIAYYVYGLRKIIV